MELLENTKLIAHIYCSTRLCLLSESSDITGIKAVAHQTFVFFLCPSKTYLLFKDNLAIVHVKFFPDEFFGDQIY